MVALSLGLLAVVVATMSGCGGSESAHPAAPTVTSSSAPPTVLSTSSRPAAAASSATTTPSASATSPGETDSGQVSCPASTKSVSSAKELTAALTAARPGSVIGLADGVYSGQFVATASGSASAPIWLCGGPGAVLDGANLKLGYVFHLKAAKYWRLVGFSVRDGQKGVVVDASTGSIIQGLTVSDIGDEAIHLRSATTHTVVRDNTISGTGQHSKKFGEGIYVGSAKSNWCTYSACGPDRSDDNSVIGNRISATSAESIDIKEGTQAGLISNNTFDGANGLTGADSWVDVKGNGWLIEGNVGQNSPVDGFQTHSVVSGWGMANVFKNNTADVNGSGYGFHLAPILNNIVYCNNKFAHAPKGLTNATCV
jgi:hypothetical protein